MVNVFDQTSRFANAHDSRHYDASSFDTQWESSVNQYLLCSLHAVWRKTKMSLLRAPNVTALLHALGVIAQVPFVGEDHMKFIPFDQQDFDLMKQVKRKHTLPTPLERKITALRAELCAFPEFQLEFFGKRIRRRPKMRGQKGLVFGPPRPDEKHWYLFIVGGDQDQVQLNIGMWPEYIRVGLGFQIGRQVSPKIPAFQVFQTFLGVRPPLPFRDAFFDAVKRNNWRIENEPKLTDPHTIIQHLETFVIPAGTGPVFVFIGALWTPQESATKGVSDYRKVFRELMPFYEELILAGGRYVFLD